MKCRNTLLLCIVLALAACNGQGKHGNGGDPAVVADADSTLPKPEVAGGSVTGMPDKPGPGDVGPPTGAAIAPDQALPPAAPSTDDDGIAPPMPDDGMPGQIEPAPSGDVAPPGLPTPADEPTPQDAVAVVRNYYAAINAHDYARAWASWSDGGRASGQTPQQFADGFANTATVTVQPDAPGRVDAAAGSRYIEVPVTITATQRDGSVRHYAGAYTLRRAVVDGATADQRAWRIASANLREVKP